MAFWNRQSRDARIAKAVVEALTKDLSGTPLSGANYTSAQPMNPVATPSSAVPTASWLASLPRNPDAFSGTLGPGEPFRVAPLDRPQPGARAPMPRLSQYEPAWNLNLIAQNYTWTQVSKLVDHCDIIRRCVDIAISEVVKMDLTFGLTDTAITTIMQEQNCGHSKAARIGRDIYSCLLYTSPSPRD